MKRSLSASPDKILTSDRFVNFVSTIAVTAATNAVKNLLDLNKPNSPVFVGSAEVADSPRQLSHALHL